MGSNLWNQWSECHQDPDQQKRIKSASSAACTPVELDRDACTGIFKGSSGTHSASLEKCSCIDYNRRRLPCKHMYRLAMELGLLDANFKSDASAIVQPRPRSQIEKIERTVETIESLTNDQQYLLLDLIRKMSFTKQDVGMELSPDISALIDCNLLELADDVPTVLQKCKKDELVTLATSFGCESAKKLKKSELINYLLADHLDDLRGYQLGYVVVRESLHIKYGKVRMYLHRKFDNQYVEREDGSIYEVPLLETELPHDDVTALLIKYGYYNP